MARILLVEDDQLLRRDVLRALQEAGHKVDDAATASEAKSFITTRPYDLVLTDMRLGDGSGIEIADIATGKGINAIVVTGYGLQVADDERRRHSFLFKPVRLDDLLSAVSKTLSDILPRLH
jgi:DNA-binding NtrC family response regulator